MTLKPKFLLLFALLVSAFAPAQTAVPVVLAPVPQLQFFDQSGRPLSFGCVSTFASQTTNPLATFTDFTGQFQNPNPVILSAGGSANIWLQSGQAYSLTVKSSGGTNCSLGQTLYTVDGVGGGASQLNTVVTPSGGSAAFTVQSQNQLFSLTLTGNVAGSPVSFIGVIAPALVTFQITEDGGGAHTFSWPSNVTGAAPIDTVANHTTSQTFLWNGTAIFPVGPGFSSAGYAIVPLGSSYLTQDLTDSCCLGFAGLSGGLHTNNNVSIDGGHLDLGTGVQSIPAGIVYQDGGFHIVVQPGPRGKEAFPITAVSITSNVITVTGSQLEPFSPGDVVFLSGLTESFLNGQIVTVATSNGTNSFTANFSHANFANLAESRGLAETNFIKADGTLVLPDVTLGTTTPNSGFLAGLLGTQPTGNCTFYGGFGVLQNSDFGCNTNIVFPGLAHAIEWQNGGSTLIVQPSALTGNRTINVPDVSGTMPITVASGTAAMGTGGLASLSCGDSGTLTFTTGAVGNILITDTVTVSYQSGGGSGALILSPIVSNGGMTIQFCNPQAGTVTPTATTVNFRVSR
jgi:hypothetical protein